MKKALLTLALVVTSVAAFAQGKVQFINDGTRTFEIGSMTAAGDVAGPIPSGGALASGHTLVAALYGITGNNGATLNLVTAIPLTGTSLPNPGRMAAKSLILSGIPGATVASFGIVISDLAAAAHPATISGTELVRNLIDTMPTPVTGFGSAVYFGTSGLFTAIPGTSTITYPPIYATTAPPGGVSSTWAAGSVYVNAVPEPSTFALAGLGAAALLIFRRRK